jgi:hypothetical protein
MYKEAVKDLTIYINKTKKDYRHCDDSVRDLVQMDLAKAYKNRAQASMCIKDYGSAIRDLDQAIIWDKGVVPDCVFGCIAPEAYEMRAEAEKESGHQIMAAKDRVLAKMREKPLIWRLF